jgi:hypothetical protein
MLAATMPSVGWALPELQAEVADHAADDRRGRRR